MKRAAYMDQVVFRLLCNDLFQVLHPLHLHLCTHDIRIFHCGNGKDRRIESRRCRELLRISCRSWRRQCAGADNCWSWLWIIVAGSWTTQLPRHSQYSPKFSWCIYLLESRLSFSSILHCVTSRVRFPWRNVQAWRWRGQELGTGQAMVWEECEWWRRHGLVVFGRNVFAGGAWKGFDWRKLVLLKQMSTCHVCLIIFIILSHFLLNVNYHPPPSTTLSNYLHFLQTTDWYYTSTV